MPPRSAKVDPLRNFKFRIRIDGKVVAGLTKCSAITISVGSSDFRTGDDESFKRKLPGQTTFEPITLDQGVTSDKLFEGWATVMSNYVGNKGADSQKKLENLRKDVDIEVYGLDNERVKAYRVYNCWVSKYTAVPGLDAAANDVLIQSIELQNEGIQVLQ
jgi:phage tail-like protein